MLRHMVLASLMLVGCADAGSTKDAGIGGTAFPDFSVAPSDLSVPDLAAADLGIPDLSISLDLTVSPDLTATPIDSAPPADLLPSIDAACDCSQCATAASTCSGQNRITYQPSGQCDLHGICQCDSTSTPCMYGCAAGNCSNQYSGVAVTGLSSGSGQSTPVTLDKTNNTSTLGGPVAPGTVLTITVSTTPPGTVSSSHLFFSQDSTVANNTDVALSSTDGSTWTGTFAAPLTSGEVYLYVHAIPYVSTVNDHSNEYDPNNYYHYAFAVQ
jgi:hypothetical protein